MEVRVEKGSKFFLERDHLDKHGLYFGFIVTPEFNVFTGNGSHAYLCREFGIDESTSLLAGVFQIKEDSKDIVMTFKDDIYTNYTSNLRARIDKNINLDLLKQAVKGKLTKTFYPNQKS